MHDGHLMGGHARKNAAGKIIGIVVLFGVAYALLRCHVAGSVPWNEFSLLTLNKGISLGAYILITFSFSFKPLVNLGFKLAEQWFYSRKALCMMGFLLVLIHALLSFLLITPTLFPRLYDPDGTLTLFAEFSMLFGVLALVLLSAYNLSFQTSLREDRRFDRLLTSNKFMRSALLLGAAHLLILGYQDWLEPGGWQGGLPPISLLAFLIFVLGSSINLLGKA